MFGTEPTDLVLNQPKAVSFFPPNQFNRLVLLDQSSFNNTDCDWNDYQNHQGHIERAYYWAFQRYKFAQLLL